MIRHFLNFKTLPLYEPVGSMPRFLLYAIITFLFTCLFMFVSLFVSQKDLQTRRVQNTAIIIVPATITQQDLNDLSNLVSTSDIIAESKFYSLSETLEMARQYNLPDSILNDFIQSPSIFIRFRTTSAKKIALFEAGIRAIDENISLRGDTKLPQRSLTWSTLIIKSVWLMTAVIVFVLFTITLLIVLYDIQFNHRIIDLLFQMGMHFTTLVFLMTASLVLRTILPVLFGFIFAHIFFTPYLSHLISSANNDVTTNLGGFVILSSSILLLSVLIITFAGWLGTSKRLRKEFI